MFRRFIVPGLMLAVILLSFRHAEVADATVPINFTRGTVTGAGFSTDLPTAITIGPDERLYVADQNGSIKALTLNANKQVTAVQTITTNGQLQEVFGIAFDPTDGSSPPAIYVTNTVSGFGDASPAPFSGFPGSYAGKVTKIHGSGYSLRTDIITGLPVSNSGHEANGLAFGPDHRLYIAHGGTTNAGLVDPDGGLFQHMEVPTGGGIVVAAVNQLGFDGTITYDEPNIYSNTVDQTGGDVSLFAYGLRNPYDLVFHSNGRFYATDNGPNTGVGPASTGCSTSGADPVAPDELDVIVEGAYYGHPNRNRGRTDPRQCVYHPGTDPSTAEYTAPIALLPASSNGILEYTSGVFGGQMDDDLLYVSWVENTLHRVQLTPDGSAVTSDTILANNLLTALDVAQGSDGTIFVAEYSQNKITFFKPDETPVSSITVTGVQPGGGPLDGGQSVTISGTNFTTTAEASVTFDGVAATNVEVQNSTTITAVTPPGSLGPANVAVNISSIGSATLTNGYQYSSGGGTTPPVAVAGDDLNTPIAHNDHAHVTLDGRLSNDPDGFITAYEWREGSNILSTNPLDSVQLTAGTHNITLTVWDNEIPAYFDTDDVRIVVTTTAENPNPWYCFDPNGDGVPNPGDQALLSSNYGKKFLQSGYTAMRDFNSDRVINVGDQAKMAHDVLTYPGSMGGCPLVDRQIRQGVEGAELYSKNINNAFAAGYSIITPWIPGQGLHLARGGVGGHDLVFEPGNPESLLYEPDPGTPGGWRLGGLMYIIPYDLTTIPPDGFATNEDAWHYHSGLCIWNNYQSIAENTTEAWCLQPSHSGAVWIDKAGWLVHIWNFLPNPKGRFVEVNNNFVGLP